jgi:hypothetical protein
MTRNLVILSFLLCVFLLPQSIRAQDSLRLLATIKGKRVIASTDVLQLGMLTEMDLWI